MYVHILKGLDERGSEGVVYLHIPKDLGDISSPATLVGTARGIDSYLEGIITQA